MSEIRKALDDAYEWGKREANTPYPCSEDIRAEYEAWRDGQTPLPPAGETRRWKDRAALHANIGLPDGFTFAICEVPHVIIQYIDKLEELLLAEPAPEAPKEGWTGKDCPKCKGTGIDDPKHDTLACGACGGTGEEYTSERSATT